MCSTFRDLSAHSDGVAGVVLPLSRMSCNRDAELIGLSWEKEYPSLTVRACDGLSWDSPAGI